MICISYYDNSFIIISSVGVRWSAELKQYDEELRRPMIALLKRGIVPDFSGKPLSSAVMVRHGLDC